MSLPLLFRALYILTLPLTLRLPSRVPKRSCTLSLSSKASGGGEDLEGRPCGRIQKAASSRAQLKKTQFLSSRSSTTASFLARSLLRTSPLHIQLQLFLSLPDCASFWLLRGEQQQQQRWQTENGLFGVPWIQHHDTHESEHVHWRMPHTNDERRSKIFGRHI